MAAASFFTLGYWMLFGGLCVYLLWLVQRLVEARWERKTSRLVRRRIGWYRA